MIWNCAVSVGGAHLTILNVRHTTVLRYSRELSYERKSQVATKERLAAMAASRCAVCAGPMVATRVELDPEESALQLRTYTCAECGHSRTYSVDAGDS